MADSTVTPVAVKPVAPSEVKKADSTKAPAATETTKAPVATPAATEGSPVASATPTKEQGKKLYMMA